MVSAKKPKTNPRKVMPGDHVTKTRKTTTKKKSTKRTGTNPSTGAKKTKSTGKKGIDSIAGDAGLKRAVKKKTNAKKTEK